MDDKSMDTKHLIIPTTHTRTTYRVKETIISSSCLIINAFNCIHSMIEYLQPFILMKIDISIKIIAHIIFVLFKYLNKFWGVHD